MARPIPGPFAGQGMNCRGCHLVDDAKMTPGGGNRSYADFARHSPIPAREDGRTTRRATRPPLVNATLARGRPFFLHFDGEFPSTVGARRGHAHRTQLRLASRRAGPAVAHMAAVIRGDDGTGALRTDFDGGPYRRVLGGHGSARSRRISGFAEAVPHRRRPCQRRADPARGGAARRGLRRIARVRERVAVRPLPREEHPAGRAARVRARRTDYAQRLRHLLAELDEPEFVTSADGAFQLIDQPFAVRRARAGRAAHLPRPQARQLRRVPPAAALHRLRVPQHRRHAGGLRCDARRRQLRGARDPRPATRNADPEPFLPATAAHPHALEPFRAPASADAPGRTDLGMWNIFRNPGLPESAASSATCGAWCAHRWDRTARAAARRTSSVDAAIGLFKTPGLRTLAQSAPYLHTGAKATVEDVVRFYVTEVGARAGRPAPQRRTRAARHADRRGRRGAAGRVPARAERGLRVGRGGQGFAPRSMRSGLAGGGQRPRSTARAPSKTTKLCDP